MSLTSKSRGDRDQLSRRGMSFGLASLAIGGIVIARTTSAGHAALALAAPSMPATPTAQDSNTIEVRLAPGLGNEWCVYNGQLSEDALARIGEATIAGVRNITGVGIVALHWDRDGHRVGPVSLGPDARSDAFNEMSVAGVWEAHVSGSESDAPQRVSLEVEFTQA